VGGIGNDTYVVDNAGDVIVEAAGGGIDTVQISASYTLGGGELENLTLTGNAAIDGTGNDRDNTIIGNSAANTLTGGMGADTLTGGAGADVFRFTSVNEFGDVLTDFQSGVDTIMFDIGDFPNSSSSTFNVIAGPYDGTNGDLTGQYQAGHPALIYSTSDNTLYYDSNGDTAGGYAAVATVQGGSDVAAGDIQVT
jgi:Ca2+-binding RTX toxin-like protein